MTQFTSVGLVGRPGSDKVIETLTRLIAHLERRGLRVNLERETACECLGATRSGLTLEEIGRSCDLAIVVGGDGSLLGAGRELCRFNTPVLGVNRGRLGFLTDISPDEVESRVDEVLGGDFEREERFLLDMEVERDGVIVGASASLNDVVLHPAAAVRMIEFRLSINHDFVYRQRSDGLIVATPTGSTAYSLSGGGPILHPRLEAMVLVPMFPHTLSSRPIVVDAASRICIEVIDSHGAELHVSCDGQMRVVVEPGDVLHIRRKAERLQLIHPPGYSYFEACRSKLGWSSAPAEQ
ncbi:NAD(+) kinase [Kushneria aurantia]|uniref:NAD kinase n=1 Tax=Kushneria aurantia TaxID=504092 RepID=A0ABV6G378_9GAMM|nr:NAD(+) kinase [Kushneria aurantia]